MTVLHKGLWHLLIGKHIDNTALGKAAVVSDSALAKMTHGEEVLISVLMRICQCLDRDIGGVAEINRTEK